MTILSRWPIAIIKQFHYCGLLLHSSHTDAKEREREQEREWERERDDLNITELYTCMVFLINTIWFNIIQFWLNPAQALIKFFLDTLHLYGFTKVLKFGSYWYIIWLESLVLYESIYLHVFGDMIEINQILDVIKFNFIDFIETV